MFFCDAEGVIHREFVREGQKVNAEFYVGVLDRLLKRIQRVRTAKFQSSEWFLLHDNAPFLNVAIVKTFVANRNVAVLHNSTYSPDLTTADENVESVRRLLTEDRRTNLQMTADRLNIGKETVRRIVTEDLEKRKICARSVPHALTTEQTQERVVYCQDLLLMGQDECFWENIITRDETWCFVYDPATKRQSAEWVGQNSPKPKKLRFQKLRVKTMLIFCFFRRRRCSSSRVCP